MKRSVTCLLLVLIAASAMAGDLAVLDNLGFSPDGRYFMFGQHVLMTGTGQAYAETAIVDVSRNEFVPGGWKKGAWKVPMYPNQESRGALYELLDESGDLKDRYSISHLEQGRLLYTRSNGDDAVLDTSSADKSVPSLTFRDFERGVEYSLQLIQENKTEKEAESTAFHIEMALNKPGGSETRYTLGRKGFFRAGVVTYEIVRVWIGPNSRSLVVAVAKADAEGSVRYMVETLVLN
jgi:predicted secreted protein